MQLPFHSLRDDCLGPLNLITGPNGSGKSNLYKALRLLAQTASGGVIHSLADEGGLHSTFWAGPEEITGAMRRGEAEIQGGPRKDVVRLKLGFASETFGYTISLGLPEPQQSAFCFDLKSNGNAYSMVLTTGQPVRWWTGRATW